LARAREKARQASCFSNLKQLGAAVQMYIGDYDETFPFVLNWSANFTGGVFGDNGKPLLLPGITTGQEPQVQLVTLAAPYVKNATIWYCPTVGPDYVWEAAVQAGWWRQGATMRDQGTTYCYDSHPDPISDLTRGIWSRSTAMAGKRYSILRQPSRWPMLWDEPAGQGFTGDINDPPTSAVPHSGGQNVAYGDGHVKYYRLEAATGAVPIGLHSGDGLYPDQ
jgi:prepilin-type processing-associated H-X9-DG protein